jgi:hypothetical protein
MRFVDPSSSTLRCKYTVFFYTTKIFLVKIVYKNTYLTFVFILQCVYINVYVRVYIVPCFDDVHCLVVYYD